MASSPAPARKRRITTPGGRYLGGMDGLARDGDHIVAIPGTASIAHMEENFAQRDWAIPAEIAARIDALINQRTVAGPRYGEAMQRSIDTECFA